MAGRSTTKLKPVAAARAVEQVTGHKKSVVERKAKKRRANAMLFGEALEMASAYDIAIVQGNGIADVLQQLLDRLMDKWRFVCKQVDALSEDEWLVHKYDEKDNKLVEPNIWIQYEATIRQELMDLALRMGHLGIDERKVRVQEAQIELLGRAVLAAAQAIGLPNAQQRELGAALREQLIMLEQGSPDPASIKPKGGMRQPVIEGSAE